MDDRIDTQLNRIFSAKNNRSLCIACDHGLMTDPDKSWLQISQIVSSAIQTRVDGLLLSSGQARRFVSKYGQERMPAFILRTDWTNLLRLTRNPGDKEKLLPVEQMQYRRLMSAQEVLYRYGGAAAIGFLFIDPDAKLEALTLKATQELVHECHQVGLPCIIEVLPFTVGHPEAAPAALLRRGVELALELDADAIKMPLTNDTEEICETIHQAGKRAFVLGGGHLSDEDLFVNQMQKALASGADGLLVGRNVSQSKDPTNLIHKLQAIVHS